MPLILLGSVHSSLLISTKEAGMGNDDHETPQLTMPLASQSFGNSLPGAISHHQQFGHQLSHHEPPHGKHSLIKRMHA